MKRILILATVIVLVTGAGIAIAQVGGDGAIYACADDKDGSLRLVAGPNDCERKEAPVFWNQQGVPGEPGQDGTDGADGADGVNGNLVLAGQMCAEEGASVIGFNADGDIICQVGGATTTTTTTTTQPPNYFDLNGEWTVTVSDEHACGDVAPSVGSAINVDHGDEPFLIWWETSEGSWHFEANGFPITDDDVIGAGGWIVDPYDQFFEADMGADRMFFSTDEQIYVNAMFAWGDPSCIGTIDFTATR